MTAPEAARAARNFMLPTVLGAFAIGIAINFALLIPALKKQGEQAREGQKARNTQCRTFPVAVKLYSAAAHYHFITASDLKTYLSAAPKGCPASPPVP